MPQDLFASILQPGADLTRLDQEFPFYPLNAPDMPVPGPNFTALAIRLGDDPPYTVAGTGKNRYVTSFGPYLHYLYRRALYDDAFQLPVDVRGTLQHAQFVPGHYLGDTAADLDGGPRPARVMIIGKHPGYEEVNARANFVGPSYTPFMEVLDQLHISHEQRAQWYVTNLVKFPNLDQQGDGLPAAWIKDCAPLLQQEIRLCRPDFILCMGSHASKALLGTYAAVTNMVGRVEEYTYPIHDSGEEPQYRTAKVMAITHPAAVFRTPELFDGFQEQFSLFLQLVNGADIGRDEEGIDHRVIYKHKDLKRIVDEIRADPSRWMIAVDCEWHGDAPTEPGAYLRTVQFSSRHMEGITVVLRYQGGSPAFVPSIDHGLQELRRLFEPDLAAGYRPRVGGWFFRADLPWLLHSGVDALSSYEVSDDFSRVKQEGFEASLQYHATNETASFKLEDVATRLTTAPRYDRDIEKWRSAYCHVHGINVEDLEGYGACPDWVLHPYACYDPDVTRRIAVRCEEPGGLLDSDWFGNSSWESYWLSHRASPACLEMELNGIRLDKARVDKLVELFTSRLSLLLADFRRQINWTEIGVDGQPQAPFNPDSPHHCRAFLFGDRYATRKQGEESVPVRPAGALTLNLTPIKSTGRRSKDWAMLVSRGEDHKFTPSTDKEVLGIIGHAHPLAMQLRDIKFMSQAIKFALRPPTRDADGVWQQDEDGFYEYDRGIAGSVRSNGRVHTHLSQHKETGRMSSYRPPLQNLSSRREDDFARIFGQWSERNNVREAVGDYLHIFDPCYQHPIRSIFQASPGHVLVSCDLASAEMAVIAWLANDPVMIDHVRRGTLPESHPDHYDIHSRQAVTAFRLDCEPTKTGLKNAGHKGKRVAAKNVNFGVPYGRMAPAIARQCREEGVIVTVEETQALIDAYFDTYRATVAFLAECRDRVSRERWLSTAFRRKRRFLPAYDRSVLREQERQAQNAPIQGTVADAMYIALANLYYRRPYYQIPYRLLLQIHDAVLLEVPISQLRWVVQDDVDEHGNVTRPSILRECMSDLVPIWPTYLDGTPRSDVTEPYHFGLDIDVMLNWGEDITEAQAEAYGIPLDLI